jgi:hypothetical protein
MKGLKNFFIIMTELLSRTIKILCNPLSTPKAKGEREPKGIISSVGLGKKGRPACRALHGD